MKNYKGLSYLESIIASFIVFTIAISLTLGIRQINTNIVFNKEFYVANLHGQSIIELYKSKLISNSINKISIEESGNLFELIEVLPEEFDNDKFAYNLNIYNIDESGNVVIQNNIKDFDIKDYKPKNEFLPQITYIKDDKIFSQACYDIIIEEKNLISENNINIDLKDINKDTRIGLFIERNFESIDIFNSTQYDVYLDIYSNNLYNNINYNGIGKLIVTNKMTKKQNYILVLDIYNRKNFINNTEFMFIKRLESIFYTDLK